VTTFTFQQDSRENTGGDDFPSRLKQRDCWLVTQDKEPVTPSSKWQHSENLLTFAEAQAEAHRIGGQVAFCFTEDDPFVGFDLDDVKRNGEFTKEARTIVQRLDSYTEVSSSGTGLHVIAEANHSDDRKHRGDLSEGDHLEVYDESRYFVLTGDVYDGHTSVESRSSVARTTQEEYLPVDDQPDTGGDQKPMSEQEFGGGDVDATPEQVRRTIREYGASSRTSVDGDAILRLWDGSDAGYSGDTSRADMAFVKHLYFWCKGDEQLIDECFRASGRMRPKWDEYRGNQTYGEMTIGKAYRGDTFEGEYL